MSMTSLSITALLRFKLLAAEGTWGRTALATGARDALVVAPARLRAAARETLGCTATCVEGRATV